MPTGAPRCLMQDDVWRIGLALASFVVLAGVPGAGAQEAAPAPAPVVRFRAVPIDGAAALAALQKALGAEAFLLVLKINRVDLAHVRQGDALVVPDGAVDSRAVSPFPDTLPDAPSPRLVLVSRRVQAFAAYESGEMVRWGPVSTGRKETETPPGLYHTNWRARLRRSTDNAQWLLPWLVNFENQRGISFHQFDLPGYPASHACVRLLETDARWMFDWAEPWVLSDDRRTIVVTGTPVVVFGDYAYGERPPWKRLASDPHAATVDVTEVVSAIEPHAALIAERARQRAEFPGGTRPIREP